MSAPAGSIKDNAIRQARVCTPHRVANVNARKSQRVFRTRFRALLRSDQRSQAMKRLLFVLFTALALTAGIGTANAHDRVSFALSYGGYYAPRPVYWESRPYWEAPPAYVASGPVYVERHYYRPR